MAVFLAASLMVIIGTVTLVAGVQKWDILFRADNARFVARLLKISQLKTFYIFSGLIVILFGMLLLIGK